ncbi:hypothetical protein QZH41_015693 [Actinostola sp. cb2023]|nr:hypothetical protein QZH41_015693 [Actinostola sp. cb2023]
MAAQAHKPKTKNLINSPENAVDEALQGIVAANPGLNLLKGHRVVIRNDVENLRKAGQVTLVSGGGSGHEPSHAGFVGKGMLTAAVAGSVFTSPPTSSILAAIRAVGKNNSGGTLLIVKNYTGDRLNFGFAAERAKSEGLKVEMVVVGEDCALTSKDKSAGRRGLCGTVLIHKASALAEEDQSLEEILAVVSAASKAMGTMSVSLSPCTIPGSGPSFVLPDDEIELGLGIHGEPGVQRVKIEAVDNIVKTMIEHMTDIKDMPINKLALSKGDHVALIVNNLGGTSYLELNIVAKAAIQYLDSDTTAPSWPRSSYSSQTGFLRADKEPLEFDFIKDDVQDEQKKPVEKLTDQGKLVFSVISKVMDAIVTAETMLNELDNLSGDGDCGTTLKRGAQAIKCALGSMDAPGIPCNNINDTLLAAAHLVEESMGGSSGAFYSLFLIAVSTALKNGTSLQYWSSGLETGVQSIMRYGGAEPGDRTMIDSLHPASTLLKEQLSEGSATTKEACERAVKVNGNN